MAEVKKVKQTNDVISDTLTRMRNAVSAKKETVVLSNTKIVLEILKVLSNANFIGQYLENSNGDIEVSLLTENGYRFTNLERVSKPGARKYIMASDIRSVKGGKGISIVSTSKGVLSGYQARKENVGGEYLCKIW